MSRSSCFSCAFWLLESLKIKSNIFTVYLSYFWTHPLPTKLNKTKCNKILLKTCLKFPLNIFYSGKLLFHLVLFSLVGRGWVEKYDKYIVNINTFLPPTDIHNSSLLYFFYVYVHMIHNSFFYLTLEYLWTYMMVLIFNLCFPSPNPQIRMEIQFVQEWPWLILPLAFMPMEPLWLDWYKDIKPEKDCSLIVTYCHPRYQSN